MRIQLHLSSYLPKAAALALAGGVALLSGCGIGNVATDVTPLAPASGIEISGTALGASTPIAGAKVYLWASGVGYGGSTTAPTQLGVSGFTTTSGAFTISPTFSQSSCTSPSTQVVYVTLSGGDPTGNDASGNTNNHAILLADVLGLCSKLTSSIKISINEATTVAAAYALGNFTTVTSNAGQLASLKIGAPTSNTQGLIDAAANAIALVDPTLGTKTTGVNGTTALVPTATVNSLADTMSVCVNATEYSSYPCADQTSPAASGLFTLATPPGGTKPSNVFQAFMNIAKYPGANVAALLQLGSSFSGFQPTLASTNVTSTTAPNDLTLGVEYVNSTLAGETLNNTTPSAQSESPVIAIDSSDNVWVLGISDPAATSTTTTNNDIFVLTSSSAGSVAYDNNSYTATNLQSSHNIRNAVFDKGGNLWMSDGSVAQSLELPYASVKTPSSVTPSSVVASTFTSLNANIAQNTWAITSDASSNIFTTSYKGAGSCKTATSTSSSNADCELIKIAAGGTMASIFQSNSAAVSTYTARSLAVDSRTGSATLGTVWEPEYGNSSGAGNTLNVISSAATTSVTVGASTSGPWGVALDSTSGGWITTNGISGLYYVAAAGTTATAASASSPSSVLNSTSAPASSATTAVPVGGLNGPTYDAVDGAGNVWIANPGYNSVVEYTPTTVGSATGNYLSPFYGFAPSLPLPAQTINITGFTQTATNVIFSAVNSLLPGQIVSFSNLPSPISGLNTGTYVVGTGKLSGTSFEVAFAGTANATVTPVTATVTASGSSQALFTCTASTTTTCAIAGSPIDTTSIAIDRAGTVWALNPNGSLVAIIGTAAPTDPIPGDGTYGVLP